MIYLWNTIKVGLHDDHFKELSVVIRGYVDSNFISDRDKRQSITRYLFDFGRNLMS